MLGIKARWRRLFGTLEVSVVVATWNRLRLLKKCIKSARRSTKWLSYEIVVVDGGSDDGTQRWCLAQPDVVLIAQKELVGAIRAFNTGFAHARGRYVVHLNDDCEVVGDCIYDAWEFLENEDSWNVGQLAFPFRDPGQEYKLQLVSHRPYANFGMTRRWLGNHVGWWGTRAHTYSGDPELSLSIQARGFRVVGSNNCVVDHLRHHDTLRARYQINKDNEQLYARWGRDWFPCPEYPLLTEKQYESGDLPFIS